MMKSRYTINNKITELRKVMTRHNLNKEVNWMIYLANCKAWIEALAFVLKNYDEPFLRHSLLKLRMDELNLPGMTGGDITKYDAVMRRHKMRWWREALTWVLTPEETTKRDWLRDENYL
ncbi:MAG: hypothetical protein ACTSQ8_18865 [Candidatus Helarchaeota archaeon]